MSNDVYNRVREFKKRYPMTVAWRIKAHSKVVQSHLNPGEDVLYAFVSQKNNNSYEIFFTNVVVITNKRILIGTKRLLWGYFLTSITPDMFNDLKVNSALIWGRVALDTVKEFVYLSNLDKKSLDEIETNITEYIMKEKQNYKKKEIKEKSEKK